MAESMVFKARNQGFANGAGCANDRKHLFWFVVKGHSLLPFRFFGGKDGGSTRLPRPDPAGRLGDYAIRSGT